MGLTSPTPIWGSYLDLEIDFKPWLQEPSAVTPILAEQTKVDDVLQALLDSACWWVQDYLARPIGPTKFQERFDGWSSWMGAYIMLPYAPVLKIISIIEWWGNSGPHPLAEQTPESQFGTGPSYGDADVYQLEPVNGKIIRTFPGLVQKPFFPGSRNIEIEWIAGFSPTPPPVRLATLMLAEYWYRNTQEAPRAVGASPYGETDVRNDLWPAVPNRVMVLLEPYVQQGMG